MLWEMVIDGVDVPEDSPARDHVAELLGRIAVRDEGSFAQLYDLLSARVFGLILRALVNRAQCEEVLQEVFLEIWQSAASFAPNKGQGRTWVMTIAHRRAVDRVRSAQSSADRDERAGLRELHSPPAAVDEQVELRIESRRVAGARCAARCAARSADPRLFRRLQSERDRGAHRSPAGDDQDEDARRAVAPAQRDGVTR